MAATQPLTVHTGNSVERDVQVKFTHTTKYVLDGVVQEQADKVPPVPGVHKSRADENEVPHALRLRHLRGTANAEVINRVSCFDR